MPDKPINLRMARKEKSRAAARAQADANAARHGQPKATREAENARSALEIRRLDGHKLDKTPE